MSKRDERLKNILYIVGELHEKIKFVNQTSSLTKSFLKNHRQKTMLSPYNKGK